MTYLIAISNSSLREQAVFNFLRVVFNISNWTRLTELEPVEMLVLKEEVIRETVDWLDLKLLKKL